jgi:hypothetical protein
MHPCNSALHSARLWIIHEEEIPRMHTSWKSCKLPGFERCWFIGRSLSMLGLLAGESSFGCRWNRWFRRLWAPCGLCVWASLGRFAGAFDHHVGSFSLTFVVVFFPRWSPPTSQSTTELPCYSCLPYIRQEKMRLTETQKQIGTKGKHTSERW